MKTKKLSLIIYLLLSLLVLPSWRNYQANDEIHHYQSAETIQVNFAIVLGEEGTPVCYVDLMKHPHLVPNFATLSTKTTTDPVDESQQKTTAVTQKRNFPPCTDRYLNHLKELATNNIVLNSDKSHIHKSAWQYGVMGVFCVLGISSYFAMSNNEENTSYPTNKGAVAAIVGAGSAVSSAHFSYQFEQIRKHIRDDWPEDPIKKDRNISKLVTKLGRLHGNMMFSMAMMTGSICYTVTDAVKGIAAIIYKNTESDSE